jgi:glycosyltransferase involved in cell wall biosynthesis
VVVDDGGRDGSYDYVQGLAADEPRLKPLRIENSGQTAAQTAGCAVAAGDVVLLLDDDVIPGPGLVTGHAGHHAGAGGVVVIGYMPIKLDGHVTSSSFSTELYAQEYERAVQRYLDDPSSILRGLWMGNLSMRRDDCTRIGLYNPRFGSIADYYHVDRDFGLRCLEGGLTGVHDRELRGQHLHTRSLRSFLSSARAQGAGLIGLHANHAETLGPITPATFSDDLPEPVRAFVRATAHETVRAPAIFVLSAWVRLAGAAKQTRLQLPAARVARRIEQQRGALDAIENKLFD